MAENYRVQYQIDQIERRSKKSGDIKALTRKQLINIALCGCEVVKIATIIWGFELTGAFGISHSNFMSHQTPVK